MRYFVGYTGVLSRWGFLGVVSLSIADTTWEGVCSLFVQGALFFTARMPVLVALSAQGY